jgi:PST family polysaccharide transporter
VSQPIEERRPSSAKRAGAVTIVGQFMKVAVQFVGLIAFSHLLSPFDVGLMAMLFVFLMLGELIRDFGLSQAAIQTAKLSHGHASNLFWSNTLIGLVMTAALVFAAPAVADMYSEPALRGLAPWIALSFPINALQTQFQVRLARDLRFVALTLTDVVSQTIGLAAGVVAALAGAGYWSLVIQMLSMSGSLLVQRALIAGWWPGRPRREPGMGALYSFGLHSGLAQLLNYGASNTDSYIIGIRWGASALGIYNRAFQMFVAPLNAFLAPLTNVALPLLSRQRHEGGDFYPLLWKAQVAISAGLTFVFALAASLAEPLVRIALGPAWDESATLLSILSIGGAVQVLTYMNFWAFLASGSARQLFHFSIVSKPLQAACIVVGSLGGLQGVAWGFTVGLATSWFVSLAWLKRCDAMPVSKFLRSGIHVLICGLVAGGVGGVLVTHLDTRLPTIVLLIAGFSLVTSVYVPLLLSSASTRRLLVDISGPALARVKVVVFRVEARRAKWLQ